METLLLTRGHPFEREPFFAMLDGVFEGLGEYAHVEHPAAPYALAPEPLAAFSRVLCYDMPGIRFQSGGPEYALPPSELPGWFDAATERGVGFVFLHHALAGWPAWPDYAELLGGRFCYTPQRLRGEAVQDSGYRHGVTHRLRKLREHPVTAGIPDSFEMTDELYLCEVFEDDVTPLLASDYEFVADNFYSAARVVVDGRMYDNEGWQHAPGSSLVGWTRTVRNSRIVYLQGGDDPVAYANEHYQRLLANALRWVEQPVLTGHTA
ncbi:MAG: ThuA domain-containing protein [Pseudomonadota bacterium]